MNCISALDIAENQAKVDPTLDCRPSFRLTTVCKARFSLSNSHSLGHPLVIQSHHDSRQLRYFLQTLSRCQHPSGPYDNPATVMFTLVSQGSLPGPSSWLGNVATNDVCGGLVNWSLPCIPHIFKECMQHYPRQCTNQRILLGFTNYTAYKDVLRSNNIVHHCAWHSWQAAQQDNRIIHGSITVYDLHLPDTIDNSCIYTGVILTEPIDPREHKCVRDP